MVRQSLDDIKSFKYFYRDKLRASSKILLVSLFLTGLLVLVIAYKFLTLRSPMHYAANSAGIITPLKRISGPNTSSQALLKRDPPEEYSVKEADV